LVRKKEVITYRVMSQWYYNIQTEAYIIFISSNNEEQLYKQSNVEHDSSVTGFRQKVYNMYTIQTHTK